MAPSESGAASAATDTARTVGRALGDLNHQRRSAVQRGQVVTASEIKFDYEMRGRFLAATDGQAKLEAKDPGPRVQAPVVPAHAAPAHPAVQPEHARLSEAQALRVALTERASMPSPAPVPPPAPKAAAKAPEDRPPLDAKA